MRNLGNLSFIRNMKFSNLEKLRIVLRMILNSLDKIFKYNFFVIIF